jgi:hypothetical protein
MTADSTEQALRAALVEADGLRSDPDILQTLGPPVNRRSPYMIAIPFAAALRLWLREIFLPRLDGS